MSWQELNNLLTTIIDDINTANVVQPSSEIWETYETEISALAASSVADQVIKLSSSPDVFSLKPVETARILSLLKQRRGARGNARELVEKIRVAVVPRTRPPFNIPVSSLADDLARIALIGNKPQYSRFQIEGWTQALETIRNKTGLVIVAPTGAGKSEVFMLPMIYAIAQSVMSDESSSRDPRFVLLYPRVTLLKDQLERIFRYIYYAERRLISSRPPSRLRINRSQNIIIGFQFEGIKPDNQSTLEDQNEIFEGGLFRIVENCPICHVGQLEAQATREPDTVVTLRCTNNGNCDAEFKTTISKQAHVNIKPHILITTEESLSRFFLTPRRAYDEYLRSISGIIYDEAHLHYGLKGAHLFNLIRNIERLQSTDLSRPAIAKIALSATITSPERFAAKLFYGDESQTVPVHDAAEFESEPSGLEVLFFLQSSQNGDPPPPPTSTMIQTAMGVGHAIFNEDKRAILFTDSVDMTKRFRNKIHDAEFNTRLWDFRTVLNNIRYNRHTCPGTDPARCPNIYAEGECWRGIIGGEGCTTPIIIRENPIQINAVYSQSNSNYWEGEIVVATSSLEVGVDDEDIKATLHYRPPRDVFSFIQRRGRAGRSPNDVAYSIMVLGNEASDQFYLYRRNRLLSAGSYELPFNPRNTRIADMHRILAAERGKMRDFINRYATRTRTGAKKGVLEWVFLTLNGCPLIREYYSTRLSNIQSLGNADSQQRELFNWVVEERRRYESYLNVSWTLQDIENECSNGMREDARAIRVLVESFLAGDRSLEADIEARVGALVNDLSGLLRLEDDPEQQENIRALRDKLERVWQSLRMQSTGGYEPELLRGLYDFFRTLGEINKPGLYNYEPTILKVYLQAFFYLGLATRNISDTSRHRGCRSCLEHYVPNNFFQQVKPLIVELRTGNAAGEPRLEQRDKEEKVSDLATMFYPYKTSYRYFGDYDLTVVDVEVGDQPRIEEGETIVDVRLRGEGLQTLDDRFMPQRIAVRRVRSDVDGDGIVKMCPQCYAIFSLNVGARFQCHPGQDLIRVKCWATPNVGRHAIPNPHEDPQSFSRTLAFLELEGDTTIYGSQVEAQHFRFDGNRHSPMRNVPNLEFEARYTRPVSYRIHTRGIRWDLRSIVPCVLQNEVLQQQLAVMNKPLTPELVLNTAVQMLYKAIASVSGVNQDALEYAIDATNYFATVWERYDGGAGISEVIRESVRTDATVLYRELLASVVCPIGLEEDDTWTSPDDLQQRLADDWLLPSDDSFLSMVALEAEAERQSGLRPERQGENYISCQDGCSVCIQVTSGINRDQQAELTSRAVSEAILRCLRKRVSGTELQDYIEQSIEQDIITPPLLFTDPAREESDVLLL
jgi:hypothetical protein